jgi:2-haloacid dehalogenase
MKAKALLFDVFGTVVNWRLGITRDVTTHFQNHPCNHEPEVIADAWRTQYQSSMEPIRSGRRGYVDLDTLHTENLEVVADAFQMELGTPEEKKWLIKAWHRLPCWPDSVSGIRALQRRFICASQSNGHIALAVNLARYNQFAWDVILGAEVVRTYKPAPEAYTRASEALGLRPEECMMVAAHNYDLKAAQEVGFQTAFIRRPTEHGPEQRIDLEANGCWDICAEAITDLATQLSCH